MGEKGKKEGSAGLAKARAGFMAHGPRPTARWRPEADSPGRLANQSRCKLIGVWRTSLPPSKPGQGSSSSLSKPVVPLSLYFAPACCTAHPLPPISVTATTMLRHALARSAWRTGRRAAGASRALATTQRRQAEVELTVGKRRSMLSADGREAAP